MTTLCLNAIVRNEAGRIVRMLDSVRNYVSCIAILDTGSTDNTIELIREWANKHHIPFSIGDGAFVNFEQARNQALAQAHAFCGVHLADYLLLVDADMELVVTDQRAFDNLSGDGYEIIQRAGGTSYNNVRLLKVGSPSRYHGVTHEFLACSVAGVIEGAHFVDHADGSNRADKYTRDIRLLLAYLEDHPDDPRSWFYLANSYRDAGQHAKAVEAYRRRVALGDWEEEKWNAQVHLAGCLKAQGLEDAFIAEALRAYQMRPQRAEPLHDLAKHFRETGKQALGMMFAEKGLGIPRPDDKLFVADWVYEWGFRDEASICGFYQEDTKEIGYRISNDLALDRSVPDHVRARARRDMVFYLPRLQELCPSTKFKEVEFAPRPGFIAMNPCITNKNDTSLELLLRTVNYKIDAAGRYMIGPKECGDAPIETENHLLTLGTDLHTASSVPVMWDRPEPKFPLVLGLEDMRIFHTYGIRRFYANVREQRQDGQCVQYHGRLQLHCASNTARVEGAVPISDGNSTEKNWAPFLYGGPAEELVYRLDVLGTVEHHTASFQKLRREQAIENISGSSQWIRFGQGMLAVVHESITSPSNGKRVYQHRFAYTNDAFDNLRLSLPFVFKDVQIEFCAGIATLPNGTVILSFGERDEKAMLATVNVKDIQCALGL